MRFATIAAAGLAGGPISHRTKCVLLSRGKSLILQTRGTAKADRCLRRLGMSAS